MSSYRGFNLFTGGTVTAGGNTFTLRGNTVSEDTSFAAWIDMLLNTPEISLAFQPLSLAGDIWIRGIPVNAEFTNSPPYDPTRAAYASSGFMSGTSTIDDPESSFRQAGSANSLYVGAPDILGSGLID